jgi:protein TonB
MTTEMQGMLGRDEFDVLLDDVLRLVANPETPERTRVNVRTRVWVTMGTRTQPVQRRPEVFAPAAFQERMNQRRSTATTMWALVAHAAAIALIFWVGVMHVKVIAPGKTEALSQLTPPPEMAPAKSTIGGGGGQRGATPVTRGQLPKFADQQITPPKAPPMEQPKIRMPDASIEVQKDLKMANTAMPNFGMPNSPLVGNSMGNGHGSGVGAGDGSGIGLGLGGDYGGGVKQVGGGVSAPVLLHSVEPEFSEEARKAKASGNVLVSLIVDPQGRPQSVRVLRGVGMGLDEKAIEAVKQYKFKPATEGGKPVAVQMNVEVEFQIF